MAYLLDGFICISLTCSGVKIFVAATLITVLITLSLPFTPLAEMIDYQFLPLLFFGA